MKQYYFSLTPEIILGPQSESNSPEMAVRTLLVGLAQTIQETVGAQAMAEVSKSSVPKVPNLPFLFSLAPLVGLS
jgi:hypothetical protein